MNYKRIKNCLFCKNLSGSCDLGEGIFTSICDKENILKCETPLVHFYDDLKIPEIDKKGKYICRRNKNGEYYWKQRNCPFFKRSLTFLHNLKEYARKNNYSIERAALRIVWEMQSKGNIWR